MMRTIGIVARREFLGYFATPLAPVFLVIFLGVSAALPFYIGGFFDRNIADLEPFFSFHPWLYMVLVPAIGMRLWAEEHRNGTLELLMTLPISPAAAVIGKFVAAWGFLTLALALTFPIWITVNYLGSPDNGVIVASYIGSWLLAGSMLAVASACSAATRNQVIAFILAVVVSFLLLMSGLELVLAFFRGWAPQFVVDLIASLSLLTHFESIMRGVIDAPGLVFFGSLIALGLFATSILVEARKGR
jgi:ABC-2 type transport system permease protein